MVGEREAGLRLHRSRRRRVGSEGRARIRRAPQAQAAGRSRRDRRQRMGAFVLRGARAQGQLRLRFAVGPPLLRVRPRQTGAVRRHGQAVRRHLPAARRRARLGSGPSRPTRCCRGRPGDRPLLPRHASAARTSTTTPRNFRSAPASTARQIPEAALVCNLPGGQAGDPGLMTHDDVVTFFHEFGHLVHTLLAGRHQWIGDQRHQHRAGLRRGAVADARRVDAGTRRRLQTFAKHFETNEPIPADARRADAARQRIRQGARRPAADGLREAVAVDLRPRSRSRSTRRRWSRSSRTSTCRRRTSRARTSRRRSATSTATRPCTTRTCGRSSSRRICSAGSIGTSCSRRRLPGSTADTILAPGGSKPAATLVRDFLGRPFDFKAWEAWLNRD